MVIYKFFHGNIQKINEKKKFIISCKNDIIAHKNEFVNTIFKATCRTIILYSPFFFYSCRPHVTNKVFDSFYLWLPTRN